MGESAYESDRMLIGYAVFRARITADNQTVHRKSTPRKVADTAAATQLLVGTRTNEKRSGATKDGSCPIRAILNGNVCRHSFRMKEVEKYGTGNCEMVQQR